MRQESYRLSNRDFMPLKRMEGGIEKDSIVVVLPGGVIQSDETRNFQVLTAVSCSIRPGAAAGVSHQCLRNSEALAHEDCH